MFDSNSSHQGDEPVKCVSPTLLSTVEDLIGWISIFPGFEIIILRKVDGVIVHMLDMNHL